MDLAFSAEEEQFRTEVREFLDANLTAELRAAGRLQTSVYSDHEASMRVTAPGRRTRTQVDIASRRADEISETTPQIPNTAMMTESTAIPIENGQERTIEIPNIRPNR